MIKTNLPVILLRGIVLLPNNEIRLEFDNDNSRSVIDVAQLFHDNSILVVSTNNPLEENPDIEDLPRIGVISKITHRMELTNGKTRVIIKGVSRANIFEYMNLNNSTEVLESIVSNVTSTPLDADLENVLIRKLYKEVESSSHSIPNMSNSVLSLIINSTDLSRMTDIIAPFLPINNSRIYDYLLETDSSVRAHYILEDLKRERELADIEKNIDAKLKNSLDDSQKEFILREKMKVIKDELGQYDLKEDECHQIRAKIDSLNAPKHVIDRLNSELVRYENLSNMSPEVNVVKNYIDWLLDIPWSYETTDNSDLKMVRKSLDESHYGIDLVKERIIEYLAVKEMTNTLNGPIICLVGPPGVGKTSLAFSIAKAINRNFVKMSVGGINDEAEIIGHRRTYIGANPGKIISSMKKAGSVNPVFLIDEIDKMTKDIKGDPSSCLLEVMDQAQNKYFCDSFLEEEYDLSRVMFIATANYVDDIPEALRDRLEIVNVNGYTEYEKLDICKNHLIRKVALDHGIDSDFVKFDDEALLKIIRYYTKEAGVRELERKIATIIRKIVTSIVIDKVKIKKKHVTVTDLEGYLGKEKYHFSSMNDESQIGVVNGLAYTNYGGDILPIEVNFYKGTGELVLTGSLGDVMKESARIALSYIKSNYEKFNIDYDTLMNNDIHIHVPEGAIPKDGPSAGISLTTALISALANISVPGNIAMTGEITLRGNVLPIGGLKEKSIGAFRNNIKTIILPKDNMSSLSDVPLEIRNNINFVFVSSYIEVIDFIRGVK